jgi:hypothetical protein
MSLSYDSNPSLHGLKPLPMDDVKQINWHYFNSSTLSASDRAKIEIRNDFLLRKQLDNYKADQDVMKKEIENLKKPAAAPPQVQPPAAVAAASYAPPAAAQVQQPPAVAAPRYAPQVQPPQVQQPPATVTPQKITTSYLNSLSGTPSQPRVATTPATPTTSATPAQQQQQQQQQLSIMQHDSATARRKLKRPKSKSKSSTAISVHERGHERGENVISDRGKIILSKILKQDWKKILNEVCKYCHD